jgi:drug/metabolite transporter (DMT)-like permease
LRQSGRSSTLPIAAAMGVVYMVWGSTYVAMRVGVRDLPPLVMSGARFLLAGLALYAWCALRRRRSAKWKPPTLAEWRSSVILGLALPAAGTGGVTWAEQKLPAGTAALPSSGPCLGASAPSMPDTPPDPSNHCWVAAWK